MPLLSHTKNPPGGFYIWIDYGPTSWSPTAGGARGARVFLSSSRLEEAAMALKDFLDGNSLATLTLKELIEIVDNWTCERLGNHPRWCRQTGAPYAQQSASRVFAKVKGGCCGHKA